MKRSRKTLKSQFCKNTLLSNVHLSQYQFEANTIYSHQCVLVFQIPFQIGRRLAYLNHRLLQESHEYINPLLRQRTHKLFWVTPKDAKL